MSYNISTTWTVILAILVLWELFWKGVALWKAARRNQLGWFVAILLVNSAGILSIIYLLIHMENPERKEVSHEAAVPIKG
jgi:hypothetical protein